MIQRRPDLRFPLPENFPARLEGRVVKRIERRAKYMLFHLDDGWTLLGHLGMSGKMTVVDGDPPPADKHDHIEFMTEDGSMIRFNDARRFGLLLARDARDVKALTHNHVCTPTCFQYGKVCRFLFYHIVELIMKDEEGKRWIRFSRIFF